MVAELRDHRRRRGIVGDNPIDLVREREGAKGHHAKFARIDNAND